MPMSRSVRGRAIPGAPLVLGAAGVIPFLVAGAGLAFGPAVYAGPALLSLAAYGAAVLSFLGGARWGAEIAKVDPPGWPVLAASVLPSLLAWGLLAAPFATPTLQIGALIVGFLLTWLWDLRSGTLPGWYPRLRTILTAGALVGLALGLSKAVSLG